MNFGTIYFIIKLVKLNGDSCFDIVLCDDDEDIVPEINFKQLVNPCFIKKYRYEIPKLMILIDHDIYAKILTSGKCSTKRLKCMARFDAKAFLKLRDEDNNIKFKMYIPLIPVSGVIGLSNNDEILGGYITDILSKIILINYNIPDLYKKLFTNTNDSNINIDVLPGNKCLYKENLKTILKTSFEIWKTSKEYNKKFLLELEFQYNFYSANHDLFKDVKKIIEKELRKIYKYCEIEFILKLKICLDIISEFQESPVKINFNDLIKTNLIYQIKSFIKNEKNLGDNEKNKEIEKIIINLKDIIMNLKKSNRIARKLNSFGFFDEMKFLASVIEHVSLENKIIMLKDFINSKSRINCAFSFHFPISLIFDQLGELEEVKFLQVCSDAVFMALYSLNKHGTIDNQFIF
ncbi:hypothetical protein TCON_1024 [Astathelohania contejeani]|uniref:Uncharacterized protein n=1 Tax=Astathelohania contejeani TaxID=164912 RepID=A0ABQ7HZY5_9MICR|nr:hypothetical protein TCON_1024 [Thelohania contejeani]